MLEPVSDNPRTKALPPDQNEAVRAYLRKAIETEFGGNARDAAAAYGVTGGLISEVLSGKRGAGMKLLRGIAAHTGQPVDGVLGGVPVRVVYAERYPRFCNSPGWPEALAEAREERPKFPEAAWLAAGETSALLLEHVTADQVIRFAQAWLDSGPAARLEQLEAEAAKRDRGVFEARVAEAERIRAKQLAAGGPAEDADAIFARLREENWLPLVMVGSDAGANDVPPAPANDAPAPARSTKRTRQ